MRKSKRPVNTREVPPDLILIVTEGEKTEPLYFRCFHLHTTKVVRIEGTGTNTISLISETHKELEKAREWYHNEYGIKLKKSEVVVWCVFDRDSFPADHFDNAIRMAEAEGYHVAYSNEAFELWYLLHFSYNTSAMNRADFERRLSSCLGQPYLKNDPNIYTYLRHLQHDAIRNAKRLRESYNPHIPSRDNPCTTVYALVEFLDRFTRGS